MIRTLSATAVLLLALGACSSDTDVASADETTASITSATPSPTPTLEVSEPAATPAPSKPPKPPAPKYPKGYPKVVPISTLPDQVRNWYEMSGGATDAVAIAPGVWAELPPGASKMDAANSEIYDGFCASITGYSRKFRHGEQFAGTCW